MEPIAFEFTLDRHELAESFRPILKWQVYRLRLFILVISGGTATFILYSCNWKPDLGTWISLTPMMLFTIWGFWRSIVFYSRATRKIFEQSKTLQSITSVVIADSGITYNSLYFSSHSMWERFSHWTETKRLIVLYDGRIATSFPKRAIGSPERIAVFRAACNEHIRHKKYQPPIRAFAVNPPSIQPPPLPDAR